MARRKKTSPLENVLDLLAMLPWWVCLVLAAVSYFLLHRLVWCLKSKHQIIELAARATDARMVSALLRHTKGLGSWL